MASRFNSALEHFRRAARLEPDWPDPLNAVAQILVVHPDAGVRNAAEALILAERAAELTGHKDAQVLDTLGAAYAATGQFTRAVTTAQAAIELASEAGAKEDVDYIRRQLEHYKSMSMEPER
jgi:cytochrome c-type biogenesis protein CcmH/NrfG